MSAFQETGIGQGKSWKTRCWNRRTSARACAMLVPGRNLPMIGMKSPAQ